MLEKLYQIPVCLPKAGLLSILVCLLLLTGSMLAQEPRAYSDFGAMGTAKVLCSAVFVSGLGKTTLRRAVLG